MNVDQFTLRRSRFNINSQLKRTNTHFASIMCRSSSMYLSRGRILRLAQQFVWFCESQEARQIGGRRPMKIVFLHKSWAAVPFSSTMPLIAIDGNMTAMCPKSDFHKTTCWLAPKRIFGVKKACRRNIDIDNVNIKTVRNPQGFVGKFETRRSSVSGWMPT